MGRTIEDRHARAVVTGAASGIGEAFAKDLGGRGGEVVCSDIDVAGAERTAKAIERDGGRAIAVACDVADLAEVEDLARQAQSWFGQSPTLVVNNAGVGTGGHVVGETPMEDWTWTLGINLWGPINGCHVFTPGLRELAAPAGIINVASAASFGSAPRMGAYNVSKAGVVSLSETLAAELGSTDVNVTVLCPTFVKTNILQSDRISDTSKGLATTLMRITGMSPERVARTCLSANLRGRLHVMPQLDARIGWQLKRTAPGTFTRIAGLTDRLQRPGRD